MTSLLQSLWKVMLYFVGVVSVHLVLYQIKKLSWIVHTQGILVSLSVLMV